MKYMAYKLNFKEDKDLLKLPSSSKKECQLWMSLLSVTQS